MITVIEYSKSYQTPRLEPREVLLEALQFTSPYAAARLYSAVGKECCLLTPVNFSASHNAVVLAEYGGGLSLSDNERDELDTSLKDFFTHYEFALKKTRDGDWLLSHNKPFMSIFSEISLMMPVQDLLPKGEVHQFWHKLFIELQMFLQTLPFNQVRERQGLPIVNGFMFWGGGHLEPNSPASIFISDRDDYLEGLSRFETIDCHQYTTDYRFAIPRSAHAVFFVEKLFNRHQRKLKFQRLKHRIHWITS